MAQNTLNLATMEIAGLAPAMVVADQVLKDATVELVGIEADGGHQSLIKWVGSVGHCRRAIEQAQKVVAIMGGSCKVTFLPNFSENPQVPLVYTSQEYSPITEGNLQLLPNRPTKRRNQTQGDTNMQAIGILETQGLTAVIQGSDAMLKAANVQIVGKEKIGGAHVTVFIRGDVASVKAAIAAGAAAAGEVGKLVAAHVIARPHDALTKLLPQ